MNGHTNGEVHSEAYSDNQSETQSEVHNETNGQTNGDSMSQKSERPEKPLNELLTNSMVDIYVGPDSSRWHLHEKLLCYHSEFFSKTFYGDYKSSHTKSFGLPDEDDRSFGLFVGWLYSKNVSVPHEEKEIGPLLDLSLMADKWKIEKLAEDTMEAVRMFYHNNEMYPYLSRVQYIYANTEPESPMRHMMVESVARYLALNKDIPSHWEKALRKNGNLSVDIIKAIHDWHLSSGEIPDPRESSVASEDRRPMKQEPTDH
ncbi:MAG: hypothetical protein M1836_002978 [Candelina mexicana]|nr:MAG: hypothetical protein M1836_002978 [Candelina mexicana]